MTAAAPRPHIPNTMQVKIITIGGKKMTTSFFKQIPERDIHYIVDEKFKPIGTVNYFWKQAPQDNPTVLHVIWQKDDDLCRCRFSDVTTNNIDGKDAEVRIATWHQIYQGLTKLPQLYLA